jgi:hypothetical protein
MPFDYVLSTVAGGSATATAPVHGNLAGYTLTVELATSSDFSTIVSSKPVVLNSDSATVTFSLTPSEVSAIKGGLFRIKAVNGATTLYVESSQANYNSPPDSGIVSVDDDSVANAITNGTQTRASLDAAINVDALLRWKANTAYTAGTQVVNPSGQIVSSIANFTSGASYNAANWTIVGTTPLPTQTGNSGKFLTTDGSAPSWGTPQAGSIVSDASTSAKGIVQLAGDIGGTAAAPTVTGGTHHGHTASQITDATTVGKSVLTAADAPTARTAIGAGTSNVTVGAASAGAGIALSSTDASVTNPRTPTSHAATHASGGSDPITPTAIGADAAGAASAAQAFAIQRANHTGTQGVATITGLATVATSGSYNDLTNKPSTISSVDYSVLPAGTTITIIKDPVNGWPSNRYSARADLIFAWKGPDPSPPIVSSGTGGMLNGVDYRLVTP